MLAATVSFPHDSDAADLQNDIQRTADLFDVDRKQIIELGQVHSANVRKTDVAGTFRGYDASVTAKGGIFHSLKTADCIPLFIYSPHSSKNALIHAGWRGLHKGIARLALEEMELTTEEIGGIKAAIGPAIRNCCYEVKEDVAALINGDGRVECRNGRLFLSLPAVMKQQLMNFGIKPENIEDSSPCTCCGPRELHSHRKNGTPHRMISIMGVGK